MGKSKRAYWDAVEANEGKIDPEKHGIGMTGMKFTTHCFVRVEDAERCSVHFD